jgi:hypothetical protein
MKLASMHEAGPSRQFFNPHSPDTDEEAKRQQIIMLLRDDGGYTIDEIMTKTLCTRRQVLKIKENTNIPPYVEALQAQREKAERPQSVKQRRKRAVRRLAQPVSSPVRPGVALSRERVVELLSDQRGFPVGLVARTAGWEPTDVAAVLRGLQTPDWLEQRRAENDEIIGGDGFDTNPMSWGLMSPAARGRWARRHGDRSQPDDRDEGELDNYLRALEGD